MSDLPVSEHDLQKLRQLAASPAGKQLMAYLKAANRRGLHAAADQAAAGNYDAAARIARDLLSAPEAKALLDQLRRDIHGEY